MKGLKCDFQNWIFAPMSNNLTCKNTLPIQKIFLFKKINQIYSFPRFGNFRRTPLYVQKGTIWRRPAIGVKFLFGWNAASPEWIWRPHWRRLSRRGRYRLYDGKNALGGGQGRTRCQMGHRTGAIWVYTQLEIGINRLIFGDECVGACLVELMYCRYIGEQGQFTLWARWALAQGPAP